MGVLFRRSKIFIDLRTMFAYTDLYVVERLIELGNDEKLDLSLFTTLVDEYTELGPDMMKYRLQSKAYINVLYSYLNLDIALKQNNDPYEFCKELYNLLLYQEFDIDDENSPVLKLAPLADSIKLIAKDTNAETICIYMDRDCAYMRESISSFMGTSKLTFAIGDKKDFLSQNTFDSYFFENVDDIEYISRKHVHRSEVIIPTFPFNVSGHDFDSNGEPIYTQDSLFKFPILDKNPSEYLSEYNLNIALIDIPL